MKTLRGAAALLLFLLCVTLAPAQSTTPNHNVSFRATEYVDFTIAPKTAAGEVAQLDAAPVVACADTAVVRAQLADATGYLIRLTSVAPGTTTCTVTAASFGRDVSETITVTVTDAQAVNLGITFKPPVRK